MTQLFFIHATLNNLNLCPEVLVNMSWLQGQLHLCPLSCLSECSPSSGFWLMAFLPLPILGWNSAVLLRPGLYSIMSKDGRIILGPALACGGWTRWPFEVPFRCTFLWFCMYQLILPSMSDWIWKPVVLHFRSLWPVVSGDKTVLLKQKYCLFCNGSKGSREKRF